MKTDYYREADRPKLPSQRELYEQVCRLECEIAKLQQAVEKLSAALWDGRDRKKVFNMVVAGE